MIVLIIIALAACAGAGYTWWRYQQISNAPAQAARPVPAPVPVFMVLDTFTVNVQNPDNDMDRVLYVGLTLQLPDEATRKALNDYLPMVRSRLLLLLSRQQSSELASEQGKQQLADKIKQTLHEPLYKGQTPAVVSDVLFTAFILR